MHPAGRLESVVGGEVGFFGDEVQQFGVHDAFFPNTSQRWNFSSREVVEGHFSSEFSS